MLLTEIIKEHFDLRPAAIINEFNLRNLPKKGWEFLERLHPTDILAEEILSSLGKMLKKKQPN